MTRYLLLCTVIFISGCDPVVFVNQRVEIQLTGLPRNEPVADATLDLAPLKRFYPNQERWTNRDWTQKHSWKPALTSSSGVAVLELRQGIMHPPFRPSYPDFISQESFICAVTHGSCVEELEIHEA